MPILAAYDDWWLASPRFRYFRAPPAGEDSVIGRPVARMGLRFAGTLMHRALPVAAISDGYVIIDEPHRATVSWRTPALQAAHETALIHAAQHFRSCVRADAGPVDIDVLIADFLFMLMQRAGELAYHADFAVGGRRSAPAKREEDFEGGAFWIFGGREADSLETVGMGMESSDSPRARLVGWPDGTIYMIDADGEAFDVSGDPELMTMIVAEVHRKRRETDEFP